MNAVEAMNSVERRVRVLTVKSKLQDTDNVLITVQDTGPGIDPKNIDRIFDAFFSTKSSGMGMGARRTSLGDARSTIRFDLSSRPARCSLMTWANCAEAVGSS
jgi:sensor histidine kinase regulating citrate/malate metabolism